MALIDIEKAFDTVWHNGLIYKLIQYGFSTYLILLVNSYIKNRYFRVFVNESISNMKIILAGIGQGTVLGP